MGVYRVDWQSHWQNIGKGWSVPAELSDSFPGVGDEKFIAEFLDPLLSILVAVTVRGISAAPINLDASFA